MRIIKNGEIINGFPVIPKENRKKILILSDDLRLPSGVGVMTREIVLGICHRFNVVQLAGAVTHPDKGKIIDMNASTNQLIGLTDAYVKIYPTDGYGNPDVLRRILDIEKPDVLMHFTDPRYWIWLYQMEHEIRSIYGIPITYLNIWDSLPFPMYNKLYYASCDLLMAISKQTYAINNAVCEDLIEKPIIAYVPHGINSNTFRRITQTDKEFIKLDEFKTNLFHNVPEKKFVIFFNSRNIRRKMIGDLILAYKSFCDSMPKDKSEKCVLLMHTAPQDENGTDLLAIIRDICPEYDVVFSPNRISPEQINFLYNIADVTVNISSNEGFGLSIAESLMAQTPVIVNVTGGLQDQCGFMKDDGSYLSENDYTTEWASNHDARYKKHGKWAKVVFPKTRSLMGSMQTPYIFDDRCDWEEVAEKIKEWYDVGEYERAAAGRDGRKYCMRQDVGMEAGEMNRRVILNLENCIREFKPKPRFKVYSTKKLNENKPKITGINKTCKN